MTWDDLQPLFVVKDLSNKLRSFSWLCLRVFSTNLFSKYALGRTTNQFFDTNKTSKIIVPYQKVFGTKQLFPEWQ